MRRPQDDRMRLAAVVAAGIAARVAIYALPVLQQTLAVRPELVTPVSSVKRVAEGAFLFDHVGSPYTGDVFHQPPLVFALFYPIFGLLKTPNELQFAAVCALFIVVDVLIACGFARLAKRTLELEEGETPMYENKEIWLHRIPVSPLLTPDNLPVMAALIALQLGVRDRRRDQCVDAVRRCWHVPLGVPTRVAAADRAASPACLLKAVSFVVWLGFLAYLSYSLSGGWGFLEETYVWIAKYSDLTPNVGIFWYFFMEVFDRFIPYFLFVLHLHPCIYVFPLYLRMKHRPQAFASVLIGIFSLFQAYPSFGDFGFFLTAISLHPKTIMSIENRYVYALGIGVATCMLPVMWFLWLFPASGNANFFYNQTLVYQVFNSQIITAFVGASMKRDKDLLKYRKRMQAAHKRE
ncbi:Gpi transamidase subunit pig-u family protein, partial [Globisporangium splendens]